MSDVIQSDRDAAHEPDLSWIDVCVMDNAGDEVIIAHSAGWAKVGMELPYLCDNVEDYEAPKEPGLYRWHDYTISSWSDDERFNIRGGTWTPYTLASEAPLRERNAVLENDNRELSSSLMTANANWNLCLDRIAVLEDALQHGRDQFAFYAEEHRKAGKFEKALTNQRFAELLDAALKGTNNDQA